MGTIGDFGQIALKWDPKNLEIRTMSVEKTLEPLVLQVTTLVNTKGPSKKKKGKSVVQWWWWVGGACAVCACVHIFVWSMHTAARMSIDPFTAHRHIYESSDWNAF